jgi:hypothetical protein
MSTRTIVLCSAACLVVMAALVGCDSKLPPVERPTFASDAGAQAIAKYDTNKDNKISGAELEKCPALKIAIKHFDGNGDGAVTADEINARLAVIEKQKITTKGIMGGLMRNGKPFAGAHIKFISESFLGDQVKTAEVDTDASGGFVVGLNPGLFRIEVTKANEKVPAKYNTATTLGKEVAVDSGDFGMPMTITLSY